MGCESSDVVRFDFEPLVQGQTRTTKLKRVYNSFTIDPRSLQCETNLQDIVGRESSDVRFDLWPLLSRSNDGSLALVSFASVLRCVGLVIHLNGSLVHFYRIHDTKCMRSHISDQQLQLYYRKPRPWPLLKPHVYDILFQYK